VEQHPGGAQRLMLAAGGAIDPFWAMYQQHNNDQVGGQLGCTMSIK
jgi:sulfite oxidase